MIRKPLAHVIIVALFFYGCKKDPILEEPFEPPLCTETFQVKPFTHEVIGFYPDYRHSKLPVANIRWELLTRIIYAFAVPQTDGHLTTSSLSAASTLTAAAHSFGVEAYVSIGGGTGSENFPLAIETQEKRTILIQDLMVFMGNNCFDGVDVDYEKFNTTGIDAIFTLFMEELYDAITPYGYKIALDVYPSQWGGKKVDDNIEPFVDYLHIMAYNFSGSWSDPGPHSSYEQAIGSGSDQNSTGIAYWHSYRAWDKAKIILGVPFYGRNFDQNGAAITYDAIIAMDSSAAHVSQWGNIYYDGLDAIERKAGYIVANQFPGMMIWELAQDVDNPKYSLLYRMDAVLNP
ncbi:MAG: glycosyl hydrolase family 18 protein [Cyclobacteriaceae bacterium]|nr:glycosyl hydrolase family 18 protein [Cyclobacteriaceae bacterium]